MTQPTIKPARYASHAIYCYALYFDGSPESAQGFREWLGDRIAYDPKTRHLAYTAVHDEIERQFVMPADTYGIRIYGCSLDEIFPMSADRFEARYGPIEPVVAQEVSR